MHAFSNHAVVLYNVTPIDLLAQSAVLSDGVVVACLHKYSAGPFPSCGGVAGVMEPLKKYSAPTIHYFF